MGNSNFGISVPEGHIEVLEAAAENITHVAAAADRAGGELRKAAKVDGWEGDASKAFTQAITEGVKPADIADKELPHAAKALKELAHDLKIARHATHDAVEQARAADRRRESAEHDGKTAQTQLNNRNAEAADLKLALDRAVERHDPVAEHHVRELLRKVKHDAAEAEKAVGDARQRLSKAVDNLEDARRDGDRANKRYEAACQRTAKVLQAVGATAPGAAKGDTALTWKDAYAVMQVGWKVGDKRVSGREVAAGLFAVFHAKQRIPVANRGDFWKLITPELKAIMSKEKKKKPVWKGSKGGRDPGAVVATLGQAKFEVGSKALFIGAGDPLTGGALAPPEPQEAPPEAQPA